MANDISQSVAEFERARSQLLSVATQKGQLQLQSEALAKTVEELKKTKEEKVYKAAGNIVILMDAKTALKEVEEQKESVDLRFKTIDKQETSLTDKLNKLKSEIEKAQAKMPSVNSSKTDSTSTNSVM